MIADGMVYILADAVGGFGSYIFSLISSLKNS